jgi:hypothetical protein
VGGPGVQVGGRRRGVLVGVGERAVGEEGDGGGEEVQAARRRAKRVKRRRGEKGRRRRGEKGRRRKGEEGKRRFEIGDGGVRVAEGGRGVFMGNPTFEAGISGNL